MEEEVYPLIYTAAAGKYTCKVTTAGMSMEHHFEVIGKWILWDISVLYIIKFLLSVKGRN